MEEKPLILVTNDDGFDAPGIEALAEAMLEVGEVYVMAPDVERSAKGHAGAKSNRTYDDEGVERQTGPGEADEDARADVAHSLNIKERPFPTPVEGKEGVYRVNGTPADCVHLAIAMEGLLPRQPDLVVSGINLGPNLGDDVYRSGTVAGAREGAFAGVPAIAFSLAVGRSGSWNLLRRGPKFTYAARYAVSLARYVLEKRLAERTYLNVNVPEGEPRKEPRMTVLEPPSRGLEEDSTSRQPERRAAVRVPPLTDRNALFLGHISVTPLQTDATNYRIWRELDENLPDLRAVSPALEHER